MADTFDGNPNGGSGRCMCGSVRYKVDGPLRSIIFCHCIECQRMAGGFWAATGCYRDTLSIEDPKDALRWYQSSDHARRGFCAKCGSSMFYQSDQRPNMAGITAGTLDRPTGLKARVHIFTREAGDYYDIEGDLPKFEDFSHGLTLPPRD